MNRCSCELRDRQWNGYDRCLRCGCPYVDVRKAVPATPDHKPTSKTCAAYDQIADRTCRYYADHGGKHNFARLDHDCALERELRQALDEMTAARDEACQLLLAENARLTKAVNEAPEFLEAVKAATSAESIQLCAALREALDIFDATWCPEHGHAPSPEKLDRIAELRKLVQP